MLHTACMTPSRIEAKEKLADLLKRSRRGALLKQTDLADKLEISSRTIISWEKGETEPPATTVVEWLRICGRNPAEFVAVLEDLEEVTFRSRCGSLSVQPTLPGFDGGVWVAAAPAYSDRGRELQAA